MRGGKREGAGRPSKGERITITLRISEEAKEMLDIMCYTHACTQGELLECFLSMHADE